MATGYAQLLSHNNSDSSSRKQIPAVSGQSGNGNDWRQEVLQTPISAESSVVPMATEVNPSLYEELKLGHDRAGFKRLVS